MNEKEISSRLDQMIAMMADGKAIQAFDSFYHDDIEKDTFHRPVEYFLGH